jgi:hypothetical protein
MHFSAGEIRSSIPPIHFSLTQTFLSLPEGIFSTK